MPAPVYICAFYRPPNTDAQPIQQLSISITKLFNRSKTPPNIRETSTFLELRGGRAMARSVGQLMEVDLTLYFQM